MTEKSTEQQLSDALKELELLRMEQRQGKNAWVAWHSQSNRLGEIEVSVHLLAKISDKEWNTMFKNIRVLQAIPDIFKGSITYICSGPMFELYKEGFNVPKYTVIVNQEDDTFTVSYEKYD